MNSHSVFEDDSNTTEWPGVSRNLHLAGEEFSAFIVAVDSLHRPAHSGKAGKAPVSSTLGAIAPRHNNEFLRQGYADLQQNQRQRWFSAARQYRSRGSIWNMA
jgi:hypothetical protein